jgi:hypothetical protein
MRKGFVGARGSVFWNPCEGVTAEELARTLTEVAAHVPVDRMRRARRGPKTPRKPKTSGKRNHHVSTRRLLDEAAKDRPP